MKKVSGLKKSQDMERLAAQKITTRARASFGLTLPLGMGRACQIYLSLSRSM